MRQLLLLLAVLTVGIFSTEAQEYRYAKRGYFGTARVSATNVYSIHTSSPGFSAEVINGSFGFYCLEPQVGVAVRLKGGRMLDLGLSLYSDVGRGFNGFPKLGIGFTW